MKTLLVASVVALLLSHPLRADPRQQKDAGCRGPESGERLVFVTGSHIPQRIKLKPIGTATAWPVRIIDRREIAATGRFTTAGVFAYEPSVTIVGR